MIATPPPPISHRSRLRIVPQDSVLQAGYSRAGICLKLRGAMLDRLFVYGTLMRGYDHPMARQLSSGADYLGPATITGRLYLVHYYPGLVASDDPAEIAHGEVFRLHRPLELLARLDDYEGCGPGYAEPAEYRREIARVTPHGGATLEAFVYVYNWNVARLPRIVSGRFQPVDIAG